MEKQKKELNGLFVALMWLGALSNIRVIISGLACTALAPGLGIIAILMGLLSMVSFALTAAKQKVGLYMFYTVCVLSVVIIGLIDQSMGQQQLLQSIISAVVYTILLQIRKNGKPAWDAILNG